MITDSNQVRLAKMIGRRVQEEMGGENMRKKMGWKKQKRCTIRFR
jgi:hypothetical protein